MNSDKTSGFGLMYRNVLFYRVVMRYLYGKEYLRKYQMVIDAIPDGRDVLDLCCGDCMIASQLAKKNCTYRGLDASPWFVEAAQKKGLNVTLWNGKTDLIPVADVICLQSSLYQFIPNELQFIIQMMNSAREQIIIAEPITFLLQDELVSRL